MVRAEAEEADGACIRVYPNQEEVASDVALHAAAELPLEAVRRAACGCPPIALQVAQHVEEGCHRLLAVAVSLQVLLELRSL